MNLVIVCAGYIENCKIVGIRILDKMIGIIKFDYYIEKVSESIE